MTNVGEVRPSEMETYIDKKSGKEIIKLTKTGTNIHFYFTDNSFTLGDKEIIYLHSDAHLSDTSTIFDVYSMNLETGESVRLTDLGARFKKVHSYTKTKDSKKILFIADEDLYCFERETGEIRLLYRVPVGNFVLQNPHISFDNRYVVLLANHKGDESILKPGNSQENYYGFKEKLFIRKYGYIIIARMDGSGGDIVFEDTHRLGHTQFAPDTNEYLMFCHEGPWDYVHQRIWMFNTITRHVKPCFLQFEDDCVGHEFWTDDGLVFFDNRGKGHDGTINSDKTQAITAIDESSDAIPYIGFVDKECNMVRKVELPFYCNHYHANSDNTILVGDAVEDIMLINISGEEATQEILCEHNTSWRWQDTHCHPCWSWSNDKILLRKQETHPIGHLGVGRYLDFIQSTMRGFKIQA